MGLHNVWLKKEQEEDILEEKDLKELGIAKAIQKLVEEALLARDKFLSDGN